MKIMIRPMHFSDVGRLVRPDLLQLTTSLVENRIWKQNPSGNTGFALLLDVAATDDDGKIAHVITDGLAEAEQQLLKFRSTMLVSTLDQGYNQVYN